MKISYDYDDLIAELQTDLNERLILPTEYIKVVRDTKVSLYQPIIDYFYLYDEINEPFELQNITNVLEEMEYYNCLF